MVPELREPGRAGRDELRTALEDRGHAVLEQGDVLLLRFPWNEREDGQVEVRWLAAAGRVDVRAPLPVVVRPDAEAAVAAALAAANREIKRVALRREGDGVAVVLEALVEEDGTVAVRLLERMVITARLIALSYHERIEHAALGRAQPRRLQGVPRVAERALSIDRSLRDDVAGAGVGEGPVRDVFELVQPWLAAHAVLEVRLDGGRAVHLARGADWRLTRLTGDLAAWNRIVADDGGLRFDDASAALGYALYVARWTLGERPLASPAPQVEIGDLGHEIVMWVDVGGRFARRVLAIAERDGTVSVREG